MSALPAAILFDLDDTILSFGRRIDQIAEAARRLQRELHPCPPEAAAEAMEAANEAFWADAERHKAWRRRPLVESRRLIAAEAFAALRARGHGELTDALAHRFGELFHQVREGHLRPFPDAYEVLDEIRRRGVKMALVTNGRAEIQRAKIARFELERRFDHIQIEGEHGFGKPEEKAYLHAMEVLQVGPKDTWMVGDNLEWEVAAPQRLGIWSIWHDPWGQGVPEGSPVKPDRIIRALKELLETP
jgi:putative hydrolase of the HAD superfamily